MSEILHRYRLVIIAFSLIVLALIIWLITSRQHVNKIPSRGIFIMSRYRDN